MRIIAVAIGSYTLLSYSSFARPIWIDEFLHFALGSHRTTAEAWHSICETLPTFNHGQTGVYMLVDYWLLQLGGANLFLLRLPSILAGILLLVSFIHIAENKGFGLLGTLFLFACLFAQQNLMVYAGEARPYFPLAAATIGTLAFYLVPRERRRFLTNMLGIVSIGVGVAFHPYFPLYWLSVASFCFLTHTRLTATLDCVRAFLRHCNLLISIPAAIAYFTLAKFTWLRGSPEFQMDPFSVDQRGRACSHIHKHQPFSVPWSLLARRVDPDRYMRTWVCSNAASNSSDLSQAGRADFVDCTCSGTIFSPFRHFLSSPILDTAPAVGRFDGTFVYRVCLAYCRTCSILTHNCSIPWFCSSRTSQSRKASSPFRRQPTPRGTPPLAHNASF